MIINPSAAGIGGTTGATDRAILLADGTGGSTVTSSPVILDTQGRITGLRFNHSDLTIDGTTAGSFVLHTNTGAAGEVIVTLPTLTLASNRDQAYLFYVVVNQQFRIAAASGDTIRLEANVSASGGFVRSNTIGSAVLLVALSTSLWGALFVSGTWTIDS